MSRAAVAVGIVLISFLVWLWRYTPEDEVGAWLEDHGLKDLRHHGALEGEGEAVFHQLICRGRKILRTLDGLGQPALTPLC